MSAVVHFLNSVPSFKGISDAPNFKHATPCGLTKSILKSNFHWFLNGIWIKFLVPKENTFFQQISLHSKTFNSVLELSC